MASSATGATFRAPPGDLKALAPFLQRAFETRTADPALSYWCNYHAAQMGIPLLSSLQPTSKSFLMELMDTLESQKKNLAGNDVVHGDDIVAKAYVENVALKVFAGADNEDRTGRANKGTAKKFLAAANFIDVLSNFGPLENTMNEKLKYSKWKAADIAKALREGRKPTPGAANEEEDDIQDSANVEALTGTQEAAARLATLDATHPDTEQDYIDREMAKLTAAQDVMDAEDNPDNVVTAISPDVPPHPGQFQMSREQSRLSIDERAPAEKATVGAAAAEEDDASMQIGSPNFSRPLSIISPSPSFGELQGEHSYLQHNNRNLGGASSPKPRPLPVVPGSNNSSFRGRESLPIPPGGGNTNPLEPPSRLISPGLPPHSIDTSPASGTLPSRPTIPTTSFPSAPPAPTPIIPTLASSLSSSSLIPTSTTASAPANLPSSLDPTAISRVQKLARWAISALDYDDVDTARKQLTEALEICDGKKVAQGRK